MQIGFAGVGLMGRGMVLNLLDGGHRVRVIANNNREPIDAVVAGGAEEASSLAGLVEGAAVVMLCLNDSRTVERIAAAIKPHMRRGQIVIDTTTANPSSTRRLAREFAYIGVSFVDAPMTGGPEEALAGETGALVGADEEVFNAIAPLINCYANRIVHFGPVGAGHTAKLISNYLACGMVALIADTFNTAARAKVDWSKLYDVMLAGSGNSGALRKIVGPALKGDYNGYKFSIANAAKDMGYFAEVAENLHHLSPLAATARAALDSAVERGWGDLNVSRLIDPLVVSRH
ncbi:MAG: NAD(P)-dependent oxidoreductase [Pseudomonadota bacterium]|nr:NAD(P)-dependent oxidoreductase [Pseudomonadota bacterium]